jgi:pyruvate kinase
LGTADGVIISRNDIQWEVQAEKMMIAQRWMIEKANVAAKPIFISS